MFAVRCLAVVVLVGSLSVVAKADVNSGPAGDTASPQLKVLRLQDNNDYVEQDLAKTRGEKPTVYLFVQAGEWSRPMGRFVRGLDDAADKLGGDASLVAVWLSDDVDEAKRYLPRGRDAMKLKSTDFAVFPGGKSGPADWALDDDASLTVVVANKGKVVESFGYISVNETDVPKVSKVLQETVQPK